MPRSPGEIHVAPEALWELGADVIAIGVEPDGFNINKECGSTSPEALAKKVREMRADIGIALDGDADRVVIVDENGQVVDGDQIMALIAESWHQTGRLSGGGVVATRDLPAGTEIATCPVIVYDWADAARIEKTRLSAFYGTSLETVLRALDADTVLFDFQMVIPRLDLDDMRWISPEFPSMRGRVRVTANSVADGATVSIIPAVAGGC